MKRFKSCNFFETSAKSVTTIAGATVIKDVVIVQSGVDKVGDLMDNAFIDAIVEQGNAAPTGVKCRGGHPNMCKDSLGTFIGDFHNFRAVEHDGKYKAIADLYIAEIAKKTMIDGHGISYHDYVVDMAKNHPDKFGNSIVFMADKEPAKIGEGENAKQVRKLTLMEFVASDIVDSPAATDGLFKSDEDLGIKLTEFLDENPDVFEAINKNEDALEIFMKKYANHISNNKSKTKIMGLFSKVKSLFSGDQKDVQHTDVNGQILTVITDNDTPQEGDEVQIDGAPAADGEYTFPDGSKWMVTGGKIETITPAAEENPPANPETPVEASKEVAQLRKELATMKSALEKRIEDLEKEVEESFEFISKNMKSGFTPKPPKKSVSEKEKEEKGGQGSGKTVKDIVGKP